ncbi:hypothetical protein AB9E15_33810, partial [Rhizobium leguminosarum]|uniref:hypothetical protein n=1 Tax=Rhizobium leguminosarum TaxID=384 RepID=UPI003F9D952E
VPARLEIHVARSCSLRRQRLTQATPNGAPRLAPLYLLPRHNGLEEDVDRRSGGRREQRSVLTRRACARLLARDGRTAPVI